MTNIPTPAYTQKDLNIRGIVDSRYVIITIFIKIIITKNYVNFLIFTLVILEFVFRGVLRHFSRGEGLKFFSFLGGSSLIGIQKPSGNHKFH